MCGCKGNIQLGVVSLRITPNYEQFMHACVYQRHDYEYQSTLCVAECAIRRKSSVLRWFYCVALSIA